MDDRLDTSPRDHSVPPDALQDLSLGAALKPTRLLTWASLAALILIWGTTWAAIRVGLRGIPPVTGVALRFAIASATLLALMPAFGAKLPRRRNEWRLLCANALLTATLAHFVLGERLTPKGIMGILVGFAGVAIIFSEDFQALGGSKVATATAILLISPVSAALGGVAIKRWGSGIHPMLTAALPMGMAAVLMGTLSLSLNAGRPVTFDTPSVLALLYLAFCGSALPFTLYFWLLKHQTATSMSLINYVTPVIAVTVGTMFLDEPFTVRIVIGAALVILGVAVVLVGKGRGK